MRNRFAVLLTCAAGIALISTLPASAQTVAISGLVSTGATVAEGQIDPNWTLGTNAGAYGPSLIAATSGVFPLASNWIANNATSKWLVPNNTQANHVAGNYDFLTSFNLAGLNPSSASITFRFAVDNSVSGVFLNGASLGITGGTLNSFTGFFTVNNTTNPGIFVSGTNTLRFAVTNASGTTGNPTGLRVEVNGTASVVPEANAGLLALAALPLLGAILRRRRG